MTSGSPAHPAPDPRVEILLLALLLLFAAWNLPLVRIGVFVRWQGGEWQAEIEPRWMGRLLRFLRLARAVRAPGGAIPPPRPRPHPEPEEPLIFTLFPSVRPLGERWGLLPERNSARMREPASPGKRLLLSLLRQRLRMDLRGWVKVGTGDAATTALLAGALASLSPRLRVVPDFLGPSFEGEARCIFRLSPGQIIREGWQIWITRSRD